MQCFVIFLKFQIKEQIKSLNRQYASLMNVIGTPVFKLKDTPSKTVGPLCLLLFGYTANDVKLFARRNTV